MAAITHGSGLLSRGELGDVPIDYFFGPNVLAVRAEQLFGLGKCAAFDLAPKVALGILDALGS